MITTGWPLGPFTTFRRAIYTPEFTTVAAVQWSIPPQSKGDEMEMSLFHYLVDEMYVINALVR